MLICSWGEVDEGQVRKRAHPKAAEPTTSSVMCPAADATRQRQQTLHSGADRLVPACGMMLRIMLLLVMQHDRDTGAWGRCAPNWRQMFSSRFSLAFFARMAARRSAPTFISLAEISRLRMPR